MSISFINRGTKIAREVNFDDLDKVIAEILDQVGDTAIEVLRETDKAVSAKAKNIVKDNAPVGARHGEYKKHIAVKQTKKDALEDEYTVYVKEPEYRLSHLLEFGHATPDGTGRTKAYPHFAPARDYVLENYRDEFIRRWNNGNK